MEDLRTGGHGREDDDLAGRSAFEADGAVRRISVSTCGGRTTDRTCRTGRRVSRGHRASQRILQFADVATHRLPFRIYDGDA